MKLLTIKRTGDAYGDIILNLSQFIAFQFSDELLSMWCYLPSCVREDACDEPKSMTPAYIEYCFESELNYEEAKCIIKEMVAATEDNRVAAGEQEAPPASRRLSPFKVVPRMATIKKS
jgi:hypothetical protein